jgi:hypothetical protein
MFPENNTELSPEQIQQLEEARKLIPKVREQIRRARQAGIDVTAQEQQLSELELQLNKLHSVYVRRISSS